MERGLVEKSQIDNVLKRKKENTALCDRMNRPIADTRERWQSKETTAPCDRMNRPPGTIKKTGRPAMSKMTAQTGGWAHTSPLWLKDRPDVQD